MVWSPRYTAGDNKASSTKTMARIVVHFDSIATAIAPEDGETWGGLCQRFVETRLPHPPRLLQLLKSLHPDGRMECYRFRYGDNNSTLIQPAWSAAGFNATAPLVAEKEGGVVEANATLVLRDGPLAEDEPYLSNLPQAQVDDGGDWEQMDVDLHIEKVGDPRPGDEGYESSGSGKGAFGGDRCGCFAMTQTPFPVDDGRTSILHVREHARYGGVIDRISIGTAFEAEREEAPVAAAVDTQRQAKGGERTNTKKEEGPPLKKKASPKKPAKKAAAAKSATASNPARGSNGTSLPKKSAAGKGEEGGDASADVAPSESASKKKKGKNGAKDDEMDGGSKKGAKVARPKRPPNGYMRFASDVRPRIVEENPGLKVTEIAKKIGEAYHALDDEEKKKYTDAAKEALDQFKREHPDLPKMTRKSKKKEEEKPAKEEGEPAVASASEDEDVDEEKEENLLPRVAIEDKPKPKRPVNAYIRFSNEMRPKIREENPEATPTEMMRIIGEAYKALDEDEKKPYEDAAKEAMAKFREEHGEEALKSSSKKKSKGTGGKKTRKSRGHSIGEDVEATPAAGLPEGWTEKKVPRGTGSRLDIYWFSPASSFKFRSKKEVKSFLACLDDVPLGTADDAAEAAAWEMHTKREKEEKRERSASVSSEKKDSIETAVDPGIKEQENADGDVQDVDDGGSAKEAEKEKGVSTKKRKASSASGKKKKKKKDGEKKSSKKKRKSQASPGKKKEEDD